MPNARENAHDPKPQATADGGLGFFMAANDMPDCERDANGDAAEKGECSDDAMAEGVAEYSATAATAADGCTPALTAHPERCGLRFTVVPDWCVRTEGGVCGTGLFAVTENGEDAPERADSATEDGQDPGEPAPAGTTSSRACTACVEACPAGAILLADDPAGAPLVDPARCTDCGVCQGVCDTFSSTERTVQDAAARALRAAEHGDAVYVACEACLPAGARPAVNTVTLPCLAAGCTEFWTLALTAETPIAAVCDFERCFSCEKAGATAVDRFTDAIERAQELTKRTVGFAEEAPLERSIVQDYARNGEYDRRGILRKLALDATEAASGTRRAKTASVLQDFRARQERLRATVRLTVPENDKFKAFAPEGREHAPTPPRERMMQEAMRRMPQITESISEPR